MAVFCFSSRCQCSGEFEGPRCQQLRHSFDGQSFAMYPTLEQCKNSQTIIEFLTFQVSVTVSDILNNFT